MIKNILVVCIGNICRSPIGEELLKERCKNSLSISSAGLAACVGESAHEYSITIMKKNGYDITPHTARQITDEMVVENELILVMNTSQKNEIEMLFPFIRGRVYRIGEWLDMDVEDPNNKPYEIFETIYDKLDQCVNSWVEKLG